MPAEEDCNRVKYSKLDIKSADTVVFCSTDATEKLKVETVD